MKKNTNTPRGHWLETDPNGTPWRDLMLAIDLEVDRDTALSRLGNQIVEQTESGTSGHEVSFYDDDLIWISDAVMQDYDNNQGFD